MSDSESDDSKIQQPSGATQQMMELLKGVPKGDVDPAAADAAFKAYVEEQKQCFFAILFVVVAAALVAVAAAAGDAALVAAVAALVAAVAALVAALVAAAVVAAILAAILVAVYCLLMLLFISLFAGGKRHFGTRCCCQKGDKHGSQHGLTDDGAVQQDHRLRVKVPYR